MEFDLALYLVTDSTPEILKGRDLCAIVDEAIKGGVTIVQYRDKHSDTADLIETAKKLHRITSAHGVPLLINDRVDVAIAVGAEGVHLGQDDMDLKTARELLPKGSIIGISASNYEEAVAAVRDGAHYLGIGATFATPTKTNTKNILGTAGVRNVLTFLQAMDPPQNHVGTVAIGGINLENVQRVLYQGSATYKDLDGVAVVSAIVGAADPREAAAQLSRALRTPPPFAWTTPKPRANEVVALLEQVPAVVQKLVTTSPLTHNMINFVVANFAANVALAIGASPIMSGYGEEAEDLAAHGGGLLINMGTLSPESMYNYLQAIKAYNARGNAVVFDPVGGGATSARKSAVKLLMDGGYFDLIKGNEGELKQVIGRGGGDQRGVDSGPSTLDEAAKAGLVQSLAQRERCVALMTGETDYLSDGQRTIAVGNGHHFLGKVTGTGCALGTVLSSFLAVHKEDKLLAAVAGLLVYEIAAEMAAQHPSVRGPGSFLPAFLDELHAIREMALKGENSWVVGRAKLRHIES